MGVLQVGGLPKDAEARKALAVLCSEFDWTYTEANSRAHPAGTLRCSESSRMGCTIQVNSTARNTARALWRMALKCTHGCAPIRRQW